MKRALTSPTRLIVLGLFVLAFFLGPLPSVAQSVPETSEPSFTITVQESGDVVWETVFVVQFDRGQSGIQWRLPPTLKRDSVSVQRGGIREQFNLQSTQNGHVLKTGVASRDLTGRHSYEITYQTTPKVIEATDGARISLPVITKAPFGLPQATIRLSSENVTLKDPVCTFGDGRQCAVDRSAGEYISKLQNLRPGGSVTYSVGVPKNMVPAKQSRMATTIFIILGACSLVVFACLSYAIRKRYVAIPNFNEDDLKRINPLLVGVTEYDEVFGRDIAAGLAQLAVDGVIVIRDTSDTKRLAPFVGISMELTESRENIDGFYRRLVDSIFPGQPEPGDRVSLKAVANDPEITRKISELSDDIIKRAKNAGLIHHKPKFVWSALAVASVTALVAGYLSSQLALMWAVGIAILSAAVAWGIPRQSAKQKRAKARLEFGKRRLSAQRFRNQPTAVWQSQIPLVIAFGLEHDLAQEFGPESAQFSWYNDGAETRLSSLFGTWRAIRSVAETWRPDTINLPDRIDVIG